MTREFAVGVHGSSHLAAPGRQRGAWQQDCQEHHSRHCRRPNQRGYLPVFDAPFFQRTWRATTAGIETHTEVSEEREAESAELVLDL